MDTTHSTQTAATAAENEAYAKATAAIEQDSSLTGASTPEEHNEAIDALEKAIDALSELGLPLESEADKARDAKINALREMLNTTKTLADQKEAAIEAIEDALAGDGAESWNFAIDEEHGYSLDDREETAPWNTHEAYLAAAQKNESWADLDTKHEVAIAEYTAAADLVRTAIESVKADVSKKCKLVAHLHTLADAMQNVGRLDSDAGDDSDGLRSKGEAIQALLYGAEWEWIYKFAAANITLN